MYSLQEIKDTIGLNLAAMDHIKVCISSTSYQGVSARHIKVCQQLNAFKSEASFRGPETKLLAIRSQQSKRIEARADTKIERRKKKLKTSSDGHVWI